MKKIFFIGLWCFILFEISLSAKNYNEINEGFFTTNKIDNLIIGQINNAQDSIIIAVCSFDWKPISDALIEAKNKGKKVVVLTDKRSVNMPMKNLSSNYEESCVAYIKSHGIETYLYDDSIHQGCMRIINLF
ncbi:hypothetical protein EZS27_008963 [termite gut metagenome]|uniref:Phospholipase D-like domain-containing protein n=1 Tax=termite gut metagenome TaxID=433724 RepID=A0A5J4SC87_9ZZZZ